MIDICLQLYAAMAIVYMAFLAHCWLSATQKEKDLILKPDDSIAHFLGMFLLGGLLWPFFVFRMFQRGGRK